MKKLAIFGTPINPVAAVEQLCGSSFCISFFYRHKLASQLNQLIRLTGENGMLLIDNGAFSFWKSNSTNPASTYWDAYELWAYDILRRCPQAVAIAPDSIDADVGENAALLDDFRCGLIPFERIMAVWHLGDPLDYLEYLLESGFSYLAFGSSGSYREPNTPAWHARMAQALAVVDRLCTRSRGLARPWLHLLRAQSCHHFYPFDSSDSTNLAVNHSRHRNRAQHLELIARRISEKIERSCDMVSERQPPASHAIESRVGDLHLQWLTGASGEVLASFALAGRSPIELHIEDYRATRASDGRIPVRPSVSRQGELELL